MIKNFQDWLFESTNDTHIHRFIKQGYSETVIKRYIEEFKKIKNFKEIKDDIDGVEIKPEHRIDISRYLKFTDLEKVVDYVKGIRRTDSIKISSSDIKPIFKNEHVEIFRGDDPWSCIAIKGNSNIGWCVARNDMSTNLFYNYRLNTGSTFYFVKDEKNSIEKYRFFAIQVMPDEKYIVTSSRNDGDNKMEWGKIVKICPSIKEHRKVFIPAKFTEKEERMKSFQGKHMSVDEFKKLPFEDKEAYLTVNAADEINLDLYKACNDELKMYLINFPIRADKELYNYLKTDNQKIFKRYKDLLFIRIDKANQPNDDDDEVFLSNFEYSIIGNSYDNEDNEKALSRYLSSKMTYTQLKNITESTNIKLVDIPIIVQLIKTNCEESKIKDFIFITIFKVCSVVMYHYRDNNHAKELCIAISSILDKISFNRSKKEFISGSINDSIIHYLETSNKLDFYETVSFLFLLCIFTKHWNFASASEYNEYSVNTMSLDNFINRTVKKADLYLFNLDENKDKLSKLFLDKMLIINPFSKNKKEKQAVDLVLLYPTYMPFLNKYKHEIFLKVKSEFHN